MLDTGAALQSIVVPTPAGPMNCLLGYDKPEKYLTDPYYVGVTVGRFANRINRGQVFVGGVKRQLDTNETATGNCLHGGSDGLCRQQFRLTDEGERLVCHHDSPAGAQGFPGNLSVDVVYRLLGDYALSIEFIATADAETVINLANHAYFNLDSNRGPIDAHQLKVCAQRFTPVNEVDIPTGEILTVDDSPFDLRKQVSLGDRIIDHNFVIEGEAGHLRAAAELYCPASGIGMSVHTTQPGMQIYTGDHLGAPFVPRQGIALEAQNFPDAPNQPGFPSARLAPGETYRQQTVYKFMPPADSHAND